MKTLILILLVSMAGCATAPKYSCDEYCALDGLSCLGSSSSASSRKIYSCKKSDQDLAPYLASAQKTKAEQDHQNKLSTIWSIVGGVVGLSAGFLIK